MPEVENAFLRSELVARQQRLQAALAVAPAETELTRLLAEVDAALDRMNAGNFGLCEVCHDPIEPERLFADPLVRYCLDHLSPGERTALQQDLDLAVQIQSSLLPPKDFTAGGWEVAYHYQPKGAVSGDYCDVIPSRGGPDRFVFLAGDVAGKGIAASLLMSHLHAIFRSLVSVGLPISDAMERANHVFCESTMSSHYATLICGLAGPHGEIELCSAGHCPPLRAAGGTVEPLPVSGLPLGLFCSSRYPVERLHQQPGDVLLLYTDGLTEAADRSGREYGMERLKDALAGAAGQSAARVVASGLAGLRAFVQGAPLADDLMILAIRRLGEVV